MRDDGIVANREQFHHGAPDLSRHSSIIHVTKIVLVDQTCLETLARVHESAMMVIDERASFGRYGVDALQECHEGVQHRDLQVGGGGGRSKHLRGRPSGERVGQQPRLVNGCADARG